MYVQYNPNEMKKNLCGGSAVKNLPANTGNVGLILALGISPGEENGNPLQSSCLVDYRPWKLQESYIT